MCGSAAEAGEIVWPFKFAIAQLTYEGSEGYERVQLQGAEWPEDIPGTPSLPAQYVNILLPRNAEDVKISAKGMETVVRTDILVCPAQPAYPMLNTTRPAPTPADLRAYAGTAPIPQAQAVLMGVYQMRGQRFASVRLNPVRYLPARRELRLATSLVVRLSFTESKRRAAAIPPGSAHFQEALSRLVVNPPVNHELGGAADGPKGAVDYLIITSAALSNAFQVLALHRERLNGISTRVLTVESITNTYSGIRPSGGSDAQTSIRNCIADYMANLGTRYVVLGGDDTLVPVRYCFVRYGAYMAQMPTDLYYSGLDGTWDENANGVYGEGSLSPGSLSEGDLAYDVIVGRIPVRTAEQATGYIRKLETYEYSYDSAAAQHNLLIGGGRGWDVYTGTNRPTDLVNDGHPEFCAHAPVSDSEIWARRMFRDGIRPFSMDPKQSYFFDTLTSWDGGTSGDFEQNSITMKQRFNQGWRHLFFTSHGTETCWFIEAASDEDCTEEEEEEGCEQFSTADAAALINQQDFIYTIACSTGGFDEGEPSLSEAFLRNPNGGALVYLGCSRSSWGAPSSYRGGTAYEYAYNFYSQVYSNGQPFIGAAFAEHKLARIAQAMDNGTERWTHFGVNLQGDPLVPLSRDAGVLHVNAAKPDDSGDGLTWATAKRTLQAAVDAANPGDLVLVTNGIYDAGGRAVEGAMTNRVAIDKPITVRSVNGPEVTIIQGAGPVGYRAVRCAYVGAFARLEGFTLSAGATLACGDADKEQSGGGAWCQPTALLSECIFTGNTARARGGGALGGTLIYCVLHDNGASIGGGVAASILQNSIVIGNQAEYGDNYDEFATLNYCCAWPIATGTGNIAADPKFVGTGNYRLQADSPCVDAGDQAYTMSDADFDGTRRPLDGNGDRGADVDIGIFEYVSDTSDTDCDGLCDGDEVYVYGTDPVRRDTDSDGYSDEFEVIRGSDPLNPESRPPPGTFYVDATRPDDSGDGLSWASAKRTIQAAIDLDLVIPGDIILVNDGVYQTGGRAAPGQWLTNRVIIDKPIMVRSVNGPEATSIEGQADPNSTSGLGAAAVRCVYLATNAQLFGFTLSQGYTQSGSGQNGCGGGAHCASTNAMISQCVIQSNSAYLAGGVYKGAIYNCVISFNHAIYYGGGAYNAELFNCTVVGNTATYSGGIGTCYAYNSIVYYNTAPSGSNYDWQSVFHNSCTTPGATGTDNIFVEPQIVSISNPRLLPGSPCIDAGADQAWMEDAVDLDGFPRWIGAAPDIGAYENPGQKGDVNLDGVITVGDAQLTFDFYFALGSLTPTADELWRADANEDGVITPGDAQCIHWAALGMASCLDAE